MFPSPSVLQSSTFCGFPSVLCWRIYDSGFSQLARVFVNRWFELRYGARESADELHGSFIRWHRIQPGGVDRPPNRTEPKDRRKSNDAGRVEVWPSFVATTNSDKNSCALSLRAEERAGTLFRRWPSPNSLRSNLAPRFFLSGRLAALRRGSCRRRGSRLELIQVGALKNVSLMTRAKTMFDLPRAIAASSRMLSEFDPEVVIGVGGYASGPAMVAAIRRRLPTLAFEPNVVPGFANRMIARWVSAAAVHFEETCQYFPHCRVTGVPVRSAFFLFLRRPVACPLCWSLGAVRARAPSIRR